MNWKNFFKFKRNTKKEDGINFKNLLYNQRQCDVFGDVSEYIIDMFYSDANSNNNKVRFYVKNGIVSGFSIGESSAIIEYTEEV